MAAQRWRIGQGAELQSEAPSQAGTDVCKQKQKKNATPPFSETATGEFSQRSARPRKPLIFFLPHPVQARGSKPRKELANTSHNKGQPQKWFVRKLQVGAAGKRHSPAACGYGMLSSH